MLPGPVVGHPESVASYISFHCGRSFAPQRSRPWQALSPSLCSAVSVSLKSRQAGIKGHVHRNIFCALIPSGMIDGSESRQARARGICLDRPPARVHSSTWQALDGDPFSPWRKACQGLVRLTRLQVHKSCERYEHV